MSLHRERGVGFLALDGVGDPLEHAELSLLHVAARATHQAEHFRDAFGRPRVDALQGLRLDGGRGDLLVRIIYRVEVKVSRGAKQPNSSRRLGRGRI